MNDAHLLGLSLATSSDPEAAIRPKHLGELRERAFQEVGEEKAKELLKEGEAIQLDDALEQGRPLIADLAG